MFDASSPGAHASPRVVETRRICAEVVSLLVSMYQIHVRGAATLLVPLRGQDLELGRRAPRSAMTSRRRKPMAERSCPTVVKACRCLGVTPQPSPGSRRGGEG